MKFPLSKLFATVFVASVVVFAIGSYVNSPARKIRLAGIKYEPGRKGGKFLTLPDGKEWNDRKLAEIVKIAARFDELHAIGIVGGSVADGGFRVFENAKNMSSIFIVNVDVSEAIFDYFVDITDLKYVTVTDCKNIDQTEIHEFRLANPRTLFEPF